MLAFERRLVDDLVPADAPAPHLVHEWVEGSLHAMPEWLRFGVVVASVGLSVLRPVLAGGRSPGPWLLASRFGPFRQYVRLFRSLVLFADEELRESLSG